MEIIRSVLFLYPVILCILTLSWIKVKEIKNMCSNFNFIFVWRHCVGKPIFFEKSTEEAIILNYTKHAVKQNSSVIRKGSVLYLGKSHLFAYYKVCISLVSILYSYSWNSGHYSPWNWTFAFPFCFSSVSLQV